jgi:Leishmanolysin
VAAPPTPQGGRRDAQGTVERYFAQASRQATLGAAQAAAAFSIEVRFLGGLTQTQKNAFKAAADRWSRVIVGSLPPVTVDGEVITGVLILAQGAVIDGPGGILGQAGPTRLRPASAGSAAFLPAKGEMTFDTADLDQMEQKGTLGDVITHEMGHVLGIGTVWTNKHLLQGAGTANPTFSGPSAMKEYGDLKGSGPTPVPVENTGGPGTRDSHWRESVFGNELMTGFVAAPNNPLSRMTAGSLQDLGYQVDMSAAEPYQLPNLLVLAEAGTLASHVGHLDLGMMLPHIPTVLPEGSLH